MRRVASRRNRTLVWLGPLASMAWMAWPAWMASVGAIGACRDTGSAGDKHPGSGEEIAQLRREVADLRLDLEALEAEVAMRARTDEDAVARDGAAARGAGGSTPTPVPRDVTWTFEVSPGDAQVTVDGEPVEDMRWIGARREAPHVVRVRRTGFRIAEQRVRPTEDRALRYRLLPGRGVQVLPAK